MAPTTAADVWSGATYERSAETFAPIPDRVLASGSLERDCLVVLGTRR